MSETPKTMHEHWRGFLSTEGREEERGSVEGGREEVGAEGGEEGKIRHTMWHIVGVQRGTMD